MPRIPPLRRCTSYAPGHTVHWIQALHSANKPEVARLTRRGTLTAVDGDLLTIDVTDGGGGEQERYRNHEPGASWPSLANCPRRSGSITSTASCVWAATASRSGAPAMSR